MSGQLLIVLLNLLGCGPYSTHREWLAADPASQQAVADALLLWCLPSVAAAVKAEALAGFVASPDGHTLSAAILLQMLAKVVAHPCLSRALHRLHGDGALAALRHAAAIIEALPAPRPSGMAASPFMELHSSAAVLLNQCCSGMLRKELAEEPPERVGSNSTAAAAESSSSGSEQRQAAAWRLMAVLPKLGAAIQALADEPEAATAFPADHRSWEAEIQAICVFLQQPLTLLTVLRDEPASPEQLASWAAAASAALRLQPSCCCLMPAFGRAARSLFKAQRMHRMLQGGWPCC